MSRTQNQNNKGEKEITIFDEYDLQLFQEPPDFRPSTPPPTFVTFTRSKECVQNESPIREIQLRLVGSHPLWGHYLWNAAKCFAEYLDENEDIVRGKRVLELGAGAALPSLISVVNGAEKVVITDYPDEKLIENIKYNVENLFPDSQNRNKISVLGHIWGKDPHSLLQPICSSSGTTTTDEQRFDTIILSDLIFNHSQHTALLRTSSQCLSITAPTSKTHENHSEAQILVFFTHHRPNMVDKDLNFFQEAQSSAFGFQVEKIYQRVMPQPMFEKDYGCEIVRSTVHGYRLTRALIEVK
ncbi:hypothetical protein G9A89_023499 [Geosiphon pyriformis]|nr:hypothetical protein G9A89_023499 [Geosiphon pyriformis]